MRRVVSFVLSIMIVISMFSVAPTAFAEATDENIVYILADGKYHEAKKGDMFTYEYYLQVADVRISSLDVRMTYDSEGLEFMPAVDEDGYDDYETMFPTIGSSTVANLEQEGIILYNFSILNGVSFKSEKQLFSGNFKVTAESGIYEINSQMWVLADKDLNKLVYQGEVFNEFTDTTIVPDLNEVDPPTDDPTDTPTDAPTEELTDAPTDAPTEAPTKESTDVPTDVPTDAPTDVPTDAPSATYVPTEEPTESPYKSTIYLVNAAQWDKPYAYVWNNLESGPISYPGVLMDLVGYTKDGVEVYSYTFEHSYECILFSDGIIESSDDLIYYDGHFYNNLTCEWESDVEFGPQVPTEAPSEELTEVETDTPTEEETEVPSDIPTVSPTDAPTDEPTDGPKPVPLEGKIYLINSAKWENVYLYAWVDEHINAVWPGVLMQKTDMLWKNGAEIYVLEFALDYDNIIFNNGVNGVQTMDLEIPDEYIVEGYFYDNLDNYWANGYIGPTEIPTDMPTDDPSEEPSVSPSDIPIDLPTEITTDAPTEAPTFAPTEAPTDAPTDAPTEIETDAPSQIETKVPTEVPTEVPKESTIYLVNVAQWSELYAFAWDEGSDDVPVLYPGAKMNYAGATKDGYGVYSYTYNKAYDCILFSDGILESTEYLEYKDGCFYNNLTCEWESEVEYSLELPTTAPTEAPTDAPTEAPTDVPTVEPTEKPTEDIHDVTVYLKNDEQWTTVFAFAFNKDTYDSNANWPGVEMELIHENGNGEELYAITFSNVYPYVMFTDGSEQSEELEVHDNYVYNNKTGEWQGALIDPPLDDPTEFPTGAPTQAPTDAPTEEPKESTIYLINEAKWEEPYARVWDNFEDVTMPFPGVKFEFVKTNSKGIDIYSYTFDKAYKTVVFSDGVNVSLRQTEYKDGYYFNNLTEKWTEIDETDLNQPDNEEDATIYFLNDEGWCGIFAYPYDLEDEEIIYFPAPEMELVGLTPDEIEVYSYTFDREYDMLIFYDGCSEYVPVRTTFETDCYYSPKTNKWLEELEYSTDLPVEPVYEIGDVNGDGTVNIYDATLIQRYVGKIEELTDAQLRAANTNGDTEVNIYDATYIQRYLAKYTEKLG